MVLGIFSSIFKGIGGIAKLIPGVGTAAGGAIDALGSVVEHGENLGRDAPDRRPSLGGISSLGSSPASKVLGGSSGVEASAATDPSLLGGLLAPKQASLFSGKDAGVDEEADDKKKQFLLQGLFSKDRGLF